MTFIIRSLKNSVVFIGCVVRFELKVDCIGIVICEEFEFSNEMVGRLVAAVSIISEEFWKKSDVKFVISKLLVKFIIGKVAGNELEEIKKVPDEKLASLVKVIGKYMLCDTEVAFILFSDWFKLWDDTNIVDTESGTKLSEKFWVWVLEITVGVTLNIKNSLLRSTVLEVWTLDIFNMKELSELIVITGVGKIWNVELSEAFIKSDVWKTGILDWIFDTFSVRKIESELKVLPRSKILKLDIFFVGLLCIISGVLDWLTSPNIDDPNSDGSKDCVLKALMFVCGVVEIRDVEIDDCSTFWLVGSSELDWLFAIVDVKILRSELSNDFVSKSLTFNWGVVITSEDVIDIISWEAVCSILLIKLPPEGVVNTVKVSEGVISLSNIDDKMLVSFTTLCVNSMRCTELVLDKLSIKLLTVKGAVTDKSLKEMVCIEGWELLVGTTVLRLDVFGMLSIVLGIILLLKSFVGMLVMANCDDWAEVSVICIVDKPDICSKGKLFEVWRECVASLESIPILLSSMCSDLNVCLVDEISIETADFDSNTDVGKILVPIDAVKVLALLCEIVVSPEKMEDIKVSSLVWAKFDIATFCVVSLTAVKLLVDTAMLFDSDVINVEDVWMISAVFIL